MQTLESLLGESVKNDISRWAETTKSTIQEPIENQLRETEQELDVLIFRLREIQEDKFRKRMRYQWLGAVVGGCVVAAGGIYVAMQYSVHGEIGYSLYRLLGPLVAALSAIYYGYWSIAKVRGSLADIHSKFDPEENRIERHRANLEERLRQLEMLRSGGLEALVKQRSK